MILQTVVMLEQHPQGPQAAIERDDLYPKPKLVLRAKRDERDCGRRTHCVEKVVGGGR